MDKQKVSLRCDFRFIQRKMSCLKISRSSVSYKIKTKVQKSALSKMYKAGRKVTGNSDKRYKSLLYAGSILLGAVFPTYLIGTPYFSSNH